MYTPIVPNILNDAINKNDVNCTFVRGIEN